MVAVVGTVASFASIFMAALPPQPLHAFDVQQASSNTR